MLKLSPVTVNASLLQELLNILNTRIPGGKQSAVQCTRKELTYSNDCLPSPSLLFDVHTNNQVVHNSYVFLNVKRNSVLSVQKAGVQC